MLNNGTEARNLTEARKAQRMFPSQIHVFARHIYVILSPMMRRSVFHRHHTLCYDRGVRSIDRGNAHIL